MAGSFSCDACGKAYSWKPELAGKRVKCKCGQPIAIPRTDPAAADEIGDLGDLAALADGTVSEGAYAPAAARGTTCPGCGAGVAADAVICVSCGQNLKTGKKLKSAKAAAGGGGGLAAEYAPAYRSYSAMASDGDAMSSKKKLTIVLTSVGGILLIVGAVAYLVISSREERRLHDQRMAAKPAKLEKLITNMEEAGGIGEAMKQGTLTRGMESASKVASAASGAAGGTGAGATPGAGAAPAVDWQMSRKAAVFDQRHDGLLQGGEQQVAKKFLLNPKARLEGRTYEQSRKVINDLYAMGCTGITVVGTRKPRNSDDEVCGTMIATLPTDKDARTKVFAYYRTLENVVEANNVPPQTDVGQKTISIEMREPG